MPNLKLAVRTLRRAPFVTTVAILSLGLGIGANAAIFSMFNTILLRALPVPDPGQLVNLSAPGPKPGSQSCGTAGDCEVVFSYPMFRDLEREQTVFTGLAAHRSFDVSLAFDGQTMTGDGMFVSGSYFPVLGVQPALGRLIGPGDDRSHGEAPVVVLAHHFWTTHFDERSAVLNTTITVNGKPMTVVGVAAPGFAGTTVGERPHVFTPITMRTALESGVTPANMDRRQNYWVYLFGRLKPGTSLEQAGTGLNAYYRSVINEVEAPLQTGMSEATLERFRAKQILVADGTHGQSDVYDEAAMPLQFLLVVTLCVLLIACANVANLLLARSATRAGEMAVRLSIGANRARLVTQLLAEACLLALGGGLFGILVANWTLGAVLAMLPAQIAQTMPFAVDGTVLVVTALLSLGTGVLFGLFPALHASRPDLLSILKGQSGQPSGARSAQIFRRVLATTQIVLAMTLLGASGLFLKSLVNVSRVDLGFNNPEQVLTFRLAPQRNGYPVERVQAIFRQVEEELAALPGVSSVSSSLVPLVAGSNWGNSVGVQGYPTGPDVDNNSRFNAIGPGYLRTLEMPLISGREFTASDTDGTPRVAIVNEAFARKFNLGREAVGKLMSDGGTDLNIEIVGLVQDSKYSDVKQQVPPVFMLPWRQQPRAASMSFYVRTETDPEALAGTVRSVIARIDRTLPVDNLRTLPEQIQQSVFLDRMLTTLASAFALLATVLAAIGLYGVLAYTVSQRTREFGLRMALGAPPARVRTLVLRQVAWMTGIGIAIGLGLAVLIGMRAQSLLFEIDGFDPVALGLSGLALAVVAMLAGFIPALRASRVDPMTALRYE
ncbi:MAG TPA: ABC transporter permease [Vicinamibacterales bacterium]|nr:ABC transporter permease [Vicinamibacterales bacterium]